MSMAAIFGPKFSESFLSVFVFFQDEEEEEGVSVISSTHRSPFSLSHMLGHILHVAYFNTICLRGFL